MIKFVIFDLSIMFYIVNISEYFWLKVYIMAGGLYIDWMCVLITLILHAIFLI